MAALQALAATDHVCSIDELELELIATFVGIGLERGEKCVYIADKGREGRLEQALDARGIDFGAALKSKALVLMSPEAAHLEGELSRSVPDVYPVEKPKCSRARGRVHAAPWRHRYATS